MRKIAPYLVFLAALLMGWVLGGLTAPECPVCPVCPEVGVNQVDPVAPPVSDAPVEAPASPVEVK